MQGDDPVQVRLARTADADDIARLTAQLGYDVEPAVVATRLARLLDRTDQQFLIAELDGRPVGWVHAAIAEFIESGMCVVIGGLVVDRSDRGKGVGRLLMDAAEAWAARQQCPIVRLWSSAGRTAAHRFYEQLGYSKVKTQFAFVKSLDADRQDLSKFTPRIDQ